MCRAADVGSLGAALQRYYGQSSEVDKELEAMYRFQLERQSLKQRRQSLGAGAGQSGVIRARQV